VKQLRISAIPGSRAHRDSDPLGPLTRFCRCSAFPTQMSFTPASSAESRIGRRRGIGLEATADAARNSSSRSRVPASFTAHDRAGGSNSEWLRDLGKKTGKYHGRMSTKAGIEQSDSWRRYRGTMVATNAVGLASTRRTFVTCPTIKCPVPGGVLPGTRPRRTDARPARHAAVRRRS